MHRKDQCLIAGPKFGASFLDHVKSRCQVFQQAPAFRGQRDTARMPDEQRQAQPRLKRANLVADGRGGLVQLLPRQGKAFKAGRTFKRAQGKKRGQLSHRIKRLIDEAD